MDIRTRPHMPGVQCVGVSALVDVSFISIPEISGGVLILWKHCLLLAVRKIPGVMKLKQRIGMCMHRHQICIYNIACTPLGVSPLSSCPLVADCDIDTLFTVLA